MDVFINNGLNKYILEDIINYIPLDINNLNYINQYIDKYNLNIRKYDTNFINNIKGNRILSSLFISIKIDDSRLFKYIIDNYEFDIQYCVQLLIKFNRLNLTEIYYNSKDNIKIDQSLIIYAIDNDFEYIHLLIKGIDFNPNNLIINSNIDTLERYIKYKNIFNLNEGKLILYLADNFEISKYIIDNNNFNINLLNLILDYAKENFNYKLVTYLNKKL